MWKVRGGGDEGKEWEGMGGGRGQKKFTQCGGSLQTKVMCKNKIAYHKKYTKI
jgi:tricorn protease-like protein